MKEIDHIFPGYHLRNAGVSDRWIKGMEKAMWAVGVMFLAMWVWVEMALAGDGTATGGGIDKSQLMVLATVAGTWIATWAAKKSMYIKREHIPKLSVAIGTVLMVIVEYAVFKQITASGLFNGVIAGLVTGLAAVGFHNTAVAPKKDKP